MQPVEDAAMSWALFAGWLAGMGFFATHAGDPPLGKWNDVGAWAYVTVVNHTPDSIPVGTIAPKVDRVIRLLGWVQAQDSATYRLPYSDTVVLLLINDGWLPMDVEEPSTHRVDVWPLKAPHESRGEP